MEREVGRGGVGEEWVGSVESPRNADRLPRADDEDRGVRAEGLLDAPPAGAQGRFVEEGHDTLLESRSTTDPLE